MSVISDRYGSKTPSAEDIIRGMVRHKCSGDLEATAFARDILGELCCYEFGVFRIKADADGLFVLVKTRDEIREFFAKSESADAVQP